MVSVENFGSVGGRRIVFRRLAELVGHPGNPKAHDLGVLDASVGRFGYIEPVIIDERTGHIIAGHGRTEALRVMEGRGDRPPDGIAVDSDGAWLAPVVVGWASRSDAEADAAVIALNRSTELGGWVDESLLAMLDGLADSEGGLVGVGYGEDEIGELRARLAEVERPARPVREAAVGPGSVTVYHGDCLEVLAGLPDQSVDAVVTDPPYGIDFMGRAWDDLGSPARFAEWCRAWAVECLRLLRPGGHLVAFGGARTHHRLMCGVEDAGFEIRDCGVWLYRSGFPKSADMSGAMGRWLDGEPVDPQDRADVYRVTGYLRAARDVAGWSNQRIDGLFGTSGMAGHWTSGASQPRVPSLRQWAILKDQLGMGDEVDHLVERFAATEHPEDWGEREYSGRFLDGLHDRDDEVCGGPQVWGTALKPAVEPWVLARKPVVGTTAQNVQTFGTGALNIEACRSAMSAEDRESFAQMSRSWYRNAMRTSPDGNKPADVYGVYGITDPSEAAEGGRWPANVVTGEDDEDLRYFRCAGGEVADFAKASAAEKPWPDDGGSEDADDGEAGDAAAAAGVLHPTVKPVALMRHLVKLVTPPGGTVLDPFAGTGTTGEAAVLDGFDAILVEREADYLPLIRVRLGVDPSPLPGRVEGPVTD